MIASRLTVFKFLADGGNLF